MEDDLCSTVLSELKSLGVKIPKIKKLKSNVSKQNSQEKTAGSSNKIFGVNLRDQEWILEDGIALPKFVSLATTYLRSSASNEIGLFRKGGSISRQRELRLKLENGESFERSEPNDIASLLKQWLRELPEPLIPAYLHELFIRCQNLDDDNRITAVLLSCYLLPAEHLQTLKYLLIFLADIAANCEKNKMDFHNLSVIMAPNIFVIGSETIDKSSNNVVQLHASLMQILIENAEKVGVFPSVRGAQMCSESELSSDLLDLSPKSKRKRRSGKVQDIFSGIRKLVGQNPSPVVAKRETPEKSQSNRSRSASKRKAEGDQQSMSTKKQAVLKNEWKNFALKSTPEGKLDLDTPVKSEKRTKTHTRRKSFGLLRRKERRKKSQESKDVALNAVENSEMGLKKESGTKEIEVPVTPERTDMSPLLSQSTIEGIMAGSSSFKNFKNSASICLLEVPKEELRKASVLPSGSPYTCFSERRSLSPYYLRSSKVSEGSADGKTSFEFKSVSAEKPISRKRRSLFVEQDRINVSALSDGASEVAKTFQRDVSSLSVDNFNFYATPHKQRLIKKDNESPFSKVICPSSNENAESCTFSNASRLEITGKAEVKKSNIQRKPSPTFTLKDTSSAENGLKRNSPKCLNAVESVTENSVSYSSPRHGLKRIASKRASTAQITSENLAPISSQRNGLKRDNSKCSNLTTSTSKNLAPTSSSKQGLRRNCSKNLKTILPASENIAPLTSSKQGLRRNYSKNLKTVSPTSENIAPNSSPKKELKHNGSKLSNAAVSPLETTNMRKNIITRQEAFLVRRSKSTSGKNALTQAKSLEHDVKPRLAPNRASYKEGTQSTVTRAQNTSKVKKSEKELNEIRRNSSRKGSIVRGRPNTVKSGLPTDRNIRLSNESMLSSGYKSNKVARVSSGSEVSLEYNKENSLLKVNISSELNISSSNQVGSFPFSPIASNSTFLVDSSCLKTPNAKICDSIFKDEDSKINLEMDVNKNNTGRKTSKKSRLRMSSNSDSKIHRHKNSLKISRTNSFPNPAKNKLELSSISQALNELLGSDNTKENLDITSDSCFVDNKNKEAPKAVEELKGNAEVWVSGEKFIERMQSEEEIFNKRESIAMILRNKQGHVQAKVSLYDRHVRKPTHSTPDASKFSTPLNACCRTYSLRNEISHQMRTQNCSESVQRNVSENRKLQISNGYDSTPSLKNKTKCKTPIPPPPKFNDCDLSFASPIVSYPLKEVTNISSKMENTNTEKSDCINPMKIKDEDIFLTPNVPSPIKPKRNSFSGRGPYKASKVLRSESSPVIFKKHNKIPKQSLYKCSSVANALKEQRILSEKEHSLVFETGSALSFEKLKSDQMLDEWQYEM